MLRIRWAARSYLTGLVVLLMLAVGFVAQRQITSAAFDRLEAAQAAQDAQRVRIVLEYEARLLSVFGATNSVWDNTFNDVTNSDQANFVADLPPALLKEIDNIDGVFGVGPDGTLKVGGLVNDGGFLPPATGLADPGLLRLLFDGAAPAGKGRCGLVTASAAPLLYCGFAAYHSDGGGPPAGGLIYLKALNSANLSRLEQQMSMPLRLLDREPSQTKRQDTLSSAIGDLQVRTSSPGANHIDVNVAVPTVGGEPTVLQAARDRPIHRVASDTMMKVFLLMGAIAAALLIAMALLIRRGVRQRIRPLRRTAEAVVSSGDLSLRVHSTETGDIAALGQTIDTMLDTLAAQDAEIREATAAREEQIRASYAQRRLAEQQTRTRSQAMISETVEMVMAELESVVEQTKTVRSAADIIGERVDATDSITTTVVDQARSADQAASDLEASLRRVDGIAGLISAVAGQTHLLALNATIEAVRAGEAGLGFSVVAREVKELATATARSSSEITSTVRSLGQHLSSMGTVIGEMSRGVGGIDAANAEVSAASREQNVSVERLTESLNRAIERIQTMVYLTEMLERRAAARVPASYALRIHQAGQTHCAQMLDLSETGMRFVVEADTVVEVDEPMICEILGAGDETISVRGEVVHRTTDGVDSEVGLRFVDTPSAVSARLAAMVSAALGGSAHRGDSPAPAGRD